MSSASAVNGQSSPRRLARIAGFLYLITFIGGSFGVMTRMSFLVKDDPAATAEKIVASEFLFRLAFTADLIAAAGYLGVTALLYVLLKPVNRSFSLLAAFFSLTGIAVGEANLVTQLEPLLLLKGGPYADVIPPEQLNARALAAFEQYVTGFATALVFFGFYCVSIGYLIIRSTFLPGFVGVLMIAAGSSYFLSTFSRFLAMPLPDAMAPYMMIVPAIGEGSLMLWLLIVGVNAVKWNEQADKK